jgi:putative endonuclease
LTQDIRHILGKNGEDLAAGFLEGQGYKIIERNYRCRLGEIDLIASDGGCLVFVEVKTRKSDSFASPKAAVNSTKQAHIARSAIVWLKSRKLMDKSARFDVVTVLESAEKPKLELIKNAFSVPGGYC